METLPDTLLSGFTLPSTLTTVLQDWMKGRRSEADGLNGHVAAQAMRLGIAAPVNTAVVELAHRIEAGSLKPSPDNLPLLQRLIAQHAAQARPAAL